MNVSYTAFVNMENPYPNPVDLSAGSLPKQQPNSPKRFRSKRTLFAGVIVLVITIVAGLVMYRNLNQDRYIRQVAIDYPVGWQELKLNDADKQAGIVLKLRDSDPEANLVARTIIGKLEENFDINELPDQVVAGFEKEVKGFTLLDKKVTNVGSYDSVQVHYKQVDTHSKDIYENLIVVIPTQEQTFYLTFRAKAADFGKIENESNLITTSFANYIASKQ